MKLASMHIFAALREAAPTKAAVSIVILDRIGKTAFDENAALTKPIPKMQNEDVRSLIILFNTLLGQH